MTEREMYDRLLELAYAGTPRGCRHEWVRVSDADEPYQMFVCRCGWEGGDEEAPAVGDGSQMSLGEMAEWWIGNHGDQADIRLLDDPDTGERVAQVYSCAEGLSGEGRGKRLELALGYALCAALDSGDYAGAANIILAAVDGAR